MLKQGDYDMWRLQIEQYFKIQDYSLWDVIENGPVTIEEKAKKKNDVKPKSMLLMALPNEHLMTFHQDKDAKTLFAAIETRFSRNEAAKKTQKTLLKQLYKNLSATSIESLDLIFNRLRKLVSQLAVLGVFFSQEDLNLKFLRSLPSEWNSHVMVWRNKSDLDTMNLNDLYNNFKIVEQEVRGTTSTNTSSQNMDFVSSPNPNNTNEVLADFGVSTASPQVSTANLSKATVYDFLANQLNGSQLVHEDLEQIHEEDLEEMDLKWQLALLSMRAKRVPRNQENRTKNQETIRRTVNVEDTYSKAMESDEEDKVNLLLRKRERLLNLVWISFDWSYMADDEALTNMAFMALSGSEARCKYHQKERMVNGTNHSRVNHNANTVPKAMLTRTGLKPVNSVRHVNPKRNFQRTAAYNNRNFFKKVNTAKEKVNTGRPNSAVLNAVRANKGKVGHSHKQIEDQGYFDSRCSWHMTRNISYLTNFKEFDEGYVAFGGGAKGGKLAGKGTIRTATKDETSRIFKSFIIEIENLVDKKVKIIRCDNGKEFKNRVINDFCEEKDNLGKFDRKSYEGFYVGYSTNSKGFRVYNTRTRKVEENMHIKFLENKLLIACDRPKWLFDIDTLTKSMNYVLVIAGTSFNDFSRKGASFDAGQSSMETRPSQDYILMPLWNEGSLFDSSPKALDGDNQDNNGLNTKSEINNQERPNAEHSTEDINTIGPSINTTSSSINTASPTVNTVRLSDDFFATDKQHLYLISYPYYSKYKNQQRSLS
nr:hypothetical protein [Tanacetum cinerariifolium]